MPKIQINDIELYYEVHGRGDTLLFIHGLGSSTRDWEAQLDYFSGKYQVVLVDIRGHGQSDKPAGPYSISLFANDLILFIEKMALAPLTVAGISMGGMIAFQLVVDRPDLIKNLILVNCGPEFVVRTLKERIKVWQRFLIVRVLGMRKMGEVLAKRLFPGSEQAGLRSVFVERWAENNPRAYRDAMRAIVGWSVMDQLEEISCPTLVLASDEDYTPVAEKKAFVDKIAGGKLVVIDDARHALPAERPDEFNAALEEFLSTC